MNFQTYKLSKITALTLVIGSLTGLAACDLFKSDAPTPTNVQTDTADQSKTQKWSVPEVPAADKNLLAPAPFQTFLLAPGEPEIFPRCHEIFENTGTPKDWPWTPEATKEATTKEAAALFGCSPEAYQIEPDGSRFIAYGIPNLDTHDASNLRFVAYTTDGKVRWHYLMDRSEQALNFAANFRGSFIARPSDKLICVGTLWEGGTQTACIDDTATDQPQPEPIWTGNMNFWAGTKPIGIDNSLFSADIKGITRRYPFNGVEMRHRDFDLIGGRGSLYTADLKSLYFAPGTTDAILSAYNLPDMSLRWQLQLPDRPQTSYHHILPAHDLLLIKIDDQLYGIDTQTGKVRFALTIGVDHPPIAANDTHIYLLLRRPDLANLIYQLDPKTGRVLQVATTPTGTLDMAVNKQTLMFRSVRAVRTAQIP